MSILEPAIRRKTAVRFAYVDASNRPSGREVEPVLLTCRWNAWYLLGFCRSKRDYRLFRLSRMRELAAAAGAFSREHPSGEELLAARPDARAYMTFKIRSTPEWRVALEEAFPRALFAEPSAGQLEMEFTVPEQERGWFAALLSFGSHITVVEPDALRQKLLAHAKQLVSHYGSVQVEK